MSKKVSRGIAGFMLVLAVVLDVYKRQMLASAAADSAVSLRQIEARQQLSLIHISIPKWKEEKHFSFRGK